MSTSLLLLDPALRPLARQLLDDVQELRLDCQVTSTFRSTAEQRSLYRDFLAGKRSLPVAPPGTSLHEYGLAFDLLCPTLDLQRAVGSVAPEYGLKWGGEADPVHFQLSDELLNSAEFSTSPGVSSYLSFACNLAFGGVGLLGGPVTAIAALGASLIVC